MRTSRIMAVLLIMCFTFSGASMLMAAEVQKEVTFDGKTFIVSYDKEKDKVRIKGESSIVEKDMGDASQLQLWWDGEKKYHRITQVSENCEINTRLNPTCSWKFTGGHWVRVCTDP